MCGACDARVHEANAVAKKHERARVGSYDAGIGDASGDASASAAMPMSTGISHTLGGGVDDVDDDDFNGLVDDYFTRSLMRDGTTLPADALDGAFWDENLRDLDDDQFGDDPTAHFLRDEPRLDDVDGDEVVKLNGRVVVKEESANTSGLISAGELEALARVGDFAVTSSYLGPILDDSAVRFLENNPTYGKFDSPSPSSSSFLEAEFDGLTGKLERARVRIKTEDEGDATMDVGTNAAFDTLGVKVECSQGESKPPRPNVIATSDVPPPAHDGGGCGPPSGAETYAGLPQPQTRLERLRRWKEKRKNRIFTKVIRYQSRKACADSRPRIKGKFVKVSSVPNLNALRDSADASDDDDDDERANRAKERDRIAELGLDKGLRAPPGLTRMKKGLIASASMPDFSMYDTM